MSTVNLVLVDGDYFPISDADLLILNKNGVYNPRIPKTSLSLLKATLLKSLSIEVHTWSKVFNDLSAHFEKVLTKSKINFKREKRTSYVLKLTEANQATAEFSVRNLHLYLQRYGFKATRLYKDCKTHKLVRVTIADDSEADYLSGFGLKKIKHESSETTLNLSSVCRLVLRVSASDKLKTTFEVSFEELDSAGWTATTKRLFERDFLRKKELAEFASKVGVLYEI
jgi:hypothetical protein